MTRKIYIHLSHPCQEVDVWELGDGDSEEIARKQGYVSLDWLRQVVAENERRRKEAAKKEITPEMVTLLYDWMAE